VLTNGAWLFSKLDGLAYIISPVLPESFYREAFAQIRIPAEEQEVLETLIKAAHHAYWMSPRQLQQRLEAYYLVGRQARRERPTPAPPFPTAKPKYSPQPGALRGPTEDRPMSERLFRYTDRYYPSVATAEYSEDGGQTWPPLRGAPTAVRQDYELVLYQG
jgi:hypothetical protein